MKIVPLVRGLVQIQTLRDALYAMELVAWHHYVDSAHAAKAKVQATWVPVLSVRELVAWPLLNAAHAAREPALMQTLIDAELAMAPVMLEADTRILVK